MSSFHPFQTNGLLYFSSSKYRAVIVDSKDLITFCSVNFSYILMINIYIYFFNFGFQVLKV